MDPATIAAIIVGITSLIGGAATAASTMSTNKKNIDNQWQMWNATNQYNTPLQDISRMKEAGLNPNLAFGGTPYHASPVNVGTAQPVNYDFLSTSLANSLGTYGNQKHLELDLENKALDNLMKQAEQAFQTESLAQQLDINAQQLANLKETFNQIQQSVAKGKAEEAYILLQTAHQQINYDYDKKLYEDGLPPDLNSRDRAIAGMFASLLSHLSKGKITRSDVYDAFFGLNTNYENHINF